MLLSMNQLVLQTRINVSAFRKVEAIIYPLISRFHTLSVECMSEVVFAQNDINWRTVAFWVDKHQGEECALKESYSCINRIDKVFVFVV